MATVVIMPRQGQSVESCIIASFSVGVGDEVNIGDILFEYETDKASFEEEAKVSGKVLAIFAEEGDDIPCLENVMVIGSEGEDFSEFVPKGEEEEESSPEKMPIEEVVVEEKAISTGVVNIGEEIKISPRAKTILDNQKLDISKAVPTGPNGRIIERDILELSKKGYTLSNSEEKEVGDTVTYEVVIEPDYEDIPHSNVRKVIAKSMHASLSNMAQLTINSSFDVGNILSYRKMLKANKEAMKLGNITINDIILYASSRVLLDFKTLNAHYDDEKLRAFNHVNLGMAVDTSRGLLVPTVFGADKMSLNEISLRTKEIGAMAVEGRISPDLLSGATFTISNLGSLGIESFTPVINPPQVGILGVNTIEDKIRVVDGVVLPYKAMNLSLTFDHRALDGADAAKFLQSLCKNLENFSLLLAK